MIKLTETQEITPHNWVHPDEEQQPLSRYGWLEVIDTADDTVAGVCETQCDSAGAPYD